MGQARRVRVGALNCLVHQLNCLAVQDAIVEALTYVDVSGLQDAIERLLDDKHSEFRPMLESGMWAFIDALFF